AVHGEREVAQRLNHQAGARIDLLNHALALERRTIHRASPRLGREVQEPTLPTGVLHDVVKSIGAAEHVDRISSRRTLIVANSETEVSLAVKAAGIGNPTATIRLLIVRSDSDVDCA